MKKLISCILLGVFLCTTAAHAKTAKQTPILERYKEVFSDPGEIVRSNDHIYLHEGFNTWYKIDENKELNLQMYEKMWKCPYCYHFYPYGQKCTNPGCPTNQWY